MVVKIKQDNGQVRCIGVFNDGVLHLVRSSSRHRYYDGWAFDLQVFHKLSKKGLKEIQVLDVDTAKVYIISVDAVDQWGMEIEHPPHRAQIYVPIQYWEEV